MSIKDIREFLIAVGERRRRLGLLALQHQSDDWGSRFDDSRSSEEELEDD